MLQHVVAAPFAIYFGEVVAYRWSIAGRGWPIATGGFGAEVEAV